MGNIQMDLQFPSDYKCRVKRGVQFNLHLFTSLGSECVRSRIPSEVLKWLIFSYSCDEPFKSMFWCPQWCMQSLQLIIFCYFKYRSIFVCHACDRHSKCIYWYRISQKLKKIMQIQWFLAREAAKTISSCRTWRRQANNWTWILLVLIIQGNNSLNMLKSKEWKDQRFRWLLVHWVLI